MNRNLHTVLEKCAGDSLSEVRPNLVVFNLRVVDVDKCLLGLEILNESDGSQLVSITSVSLEDKSEYSNVRGEKTSALKDNMHMIGKDIPCR